jgi:hypothetical protein
MDVIMKTSKIVLSSLLLLIWIQPGIAQSIVFKQFTLKNGLRVILSEDHAAPTTRLPSRTTRVRVMNAKARPGSHISSNT